MVSGGQKYSIQKMPCLLEVEIMGSYTSVVDSDVNVIDMERLKKYFEDVKSGKIYKDSPEIKEYIDALEIVEKNNTLIFDGWDGWKIISYWYDELCVVLRDIAVFVEGEVNLEFESRDEAGWIQFEDGKCIIHTGQMIWNQWLADSKILKYKFAMPKEVEKRLVLRKI